MPSAAHSQRGCSPRALGGRTAEDTPSPCMQIAGELQPIVTGSAIRTGAERGRRARGSRARPWFPAQHLGKSRSHRRSQNGGLASEDCDEASPGPAPGRLPTVSLLAAPVRTQVHSVRAGEGELEYISLQVHLIYRGRDSALQSSRRCDPETPALPPVITRKVWLR